MEAALKAAFSQCESALCPLSDRQKQILLQALRDRGNSTPMDTASSGSLTQDEPSEARVTNPLAQLSQTERQTLLEFIRQQEAQNLPWKITLLNDWLRGTDSGAVQFIREQYGIQWLDQVQPVHLAQYGDAEGRDVLRLKVGDRIEVTNGLWEWVQETGPCGREWFPCTVIRINSVAAMDEADDRQISCVIRFDGGAEYEIQGIYDWNRPNWRWIQP